MAPTPITPADPNASAPSVSWLPGRKVVTGGISGVLAMFILAGLSSWLHFDAGTYLQPTINSIASIAGITPPPSAQTLLSLVIGFGISYFVPAKVQSIINRITDQVIAAAIRDPKTPVTAASVIAVASKADVAAKPVPK